MTGWSYRNRKSYVFIFAIGVLSSLLGVLMGGCTGRKPILVGFAAELTGKRGEIGVGARDGAQLAVELINERGGINNRPLELIVRDDKGESETARQVDAELVEQGVVAIIGHITSQQTAAVFDQINESEVVLLSPTSSSTQFNHQADYFFRVMPSNDFFGRALASHIYNTRQVRQLTGIYDLGNRAFSETLWQSMQAEFEKLGGDASQAFTFTSGETDLQDLMAQVTATEPEAVVFVASAIDTALMAQYVHQQESEALMFSSTWAQTNELLEKGGRAVDGLELSVVYHTDNPFPTFQRFVEQFEARFNRPPSLASPFAYEAVLVLAQALKQTDGQAKGLPEALTTINNLEGVQGFISMDDYGDVKRETFIAVIEDRQFKIINTISPAD